MTIMDDRDDIDGEEIDDGCLGHCITDERGYCLGCGRPPTVAALEPGVRQALAAPMLPDASAPGAEAEPTGS